MSKEPGARARARAAGQVRVRVKARMDGLKGGKAAKPEREKGLSVV